MGGVVSYFSKIEIETILIGAKHSGRNSLLTALGNAFNNEQYPIWRNMNRFENENIKLKVWKLSNAPKFQGILVRYCRDLDVIIFVIDSTGDSEYYIGNKTTLKDT